MPKVRYCAYCHAPIREGDGYVKVLDNFLMVRYFDDNDENIFCENGCLEEYLSVNHFIFEKNNGDDSVYVNEDDEDEQV